MSDTSRLASLLSTLTIQEIKELGEYINMSSVNNRRSVVDLFNIIKEHYPRFESEEMNRADLFKRLFPGRKFNDSAIRPLLHYLYEFTADFLAVKYFRKNRQMYDHCRVNSLLERRDFRSTGRALTKAQTNLKQGDMSASQYFYHSHLLKNSKLVYYSRSRDGIYQKFLPEIDLHDVHVDLTNYYLLRTLELYLNVLNINRIYGTNMPETTFANSLNSIDENLLVKNPVIATYHYLTKLITDKENLDHYKKVKRYIKESLKVLHLEDLHEIYINLENYCNDKILNGNEEFQKEKFEIYREEITLGLHRASGSLSPLFLKSAVSLALRLNNTKWAREFLESCSEEIRKKESLKNAHLFSLASCEFAEGNFGKSLEHLAVIEFDDDYMKLDCRILQILNHFEMGLHDTMQHSADSLRHLLKTNKAIPQNRKTNFSNFNKFFRRFVRLKEKNDSYGLKKLYDEIRASSQVSQKQWLLRKLSNLKSEL